ncbi:MAG: DUF2809 domain-containing protein [Ruaniaceae bacterium]|nr:DUF2809 domain-containing protein [Ruaniaceae bacterium]
MDSWRARVRVFAAAGALLTIVVGVLGRTLPTIGNATGGIAYTLLLALIALLLWPAASPTALAGGATGVSFAVELFQMTPIPKAITNEVPALHFLIGASFRWMDLLWYAVGGVVAFGAVLLIHRLARGRQRSHVR